MPEVETEYASLRLSDYYTALTKEEAATMAATEPILAEYIGHWAEVVTINRAEFNCRALRLISDFINHFE